MGKSLEGYTFHNYICLSSDEFRALTTGDTVYCEKIPNWTKPTGRYVEGKIVRRLDNGELVVDLPEIRQERTCGIDQHALYKKVPQEKS